MPRGRMVPPLALAAGRPRKSDTDVPYWQAGRSPLKNLFLALLLWLTSSLTVVLKAANAFVSAAAEAYFLPFSAFHWLNRVRRSCGGEVGRTCGGGKTNARSCAGLAAREGSVCGCGVARPAAAIGTAAQGLTPRARRRPYAASYGLTGPRSCQAGAPWPSPKAGAGTRSRTRRHPASRPHRARNRRGGVASIFLRGVRLDRQGREPQEAQNGQPRPHPGHRRPIQVFNGWLRRRAEGGGQ